LTRFRNQTTALVSALMLVLIGWSSAAHAVSSEWVETQQTATRIIAASDALGDEGRIQVGLQFNLEPHWKVYWRSPGDAGFPPKLDFTGSENVSATDLSWPIPERFSVIGLETLGYEDEVVFPFTLAAIDPTKPAKLVARVNYLTCNDVCIPYEANLAMTIPPGKGEPTAYVHDIGKFESQVPNSPEAARLDVTKLNIEKSDKSIYLVATATSDIPLNNPDVFIEGPVATGLGFSRPNVEIADDGMSATMRVAVWGYTGPPDENLSKVINTPFVVTIRDGARAAETYLKTDETVSQADPSIYKSEPNADDRSMLAMLLFAFLGGLILNLMPCVLPVLSIKFLSVVKHAGAASGHVRASFLASAAGVITTFMIIAAALIGLKSAGAGIGWGIQFQQPWFLITMAFLVTLFACNLWGFFEVRLPGAVATAGHKAGQGKGIGGNFLQGMFATLLATPCSAPFLGTAVGFALARGATEIAVIFFVLGVGLATPYLLIAAVPKLATQLPKPGPWMDKLKIALGFALAATAVWLLSVVAGVVGFSGALWTGVALAFVTLWLGWFVKIAPEMRKATPVALMFVTAASFVNAYVGDMDCPLDTDQPALSKIAWSPFDPEVIPALVKSGKLVFVDVTADWCITCQVNKRLVLEQGRILELMRSPDVVAMQGDWTRPNDDIANYLASFNRYGIPFNAVYGPSALDGYALPELLTRDIVLNGFKQTVPEQLATQFD
jgi:suppressor for copper-sensitivity B